MSAPDRPTACLALADGTLFLGRGFGAPGEVAAELVFDTAMAGFQEIVSDPASTGRIIVFTFPHVGNTGTTPEDDESAGPAAAGIVTRAHPTEPSNWRARDTLDGWLARAGRIGISGVDTRRLSRLIRDAGNMPAILAHDPSGRLDTAQLLARAAGRGTAPAPASGGTHTLGHDPLETRWEWPGGFGRRAPGGPRIAVIDLGVRRDTLRALASRGCEAVVLPATATVDEVTAQAPAGVLVAGGRDDPAALAAAADTIRALLERGLPLAGLGAGHLALGLALGAQVTRLKHGHHGANHPVREIASRRVEIVDTSTNHVIDGSRLPEGVVATHESLFDGSNYGIALVGRPVFSRQSCADPEAGLLSRLAASTLPT